MAKALAVVSIAVSRVTKSSSKGTRRQEDAQHTIAHLGAQGGVHDLLGVITVLGLGLGRLCRCGVGQGIGCVEGIAAGFLFLVPGRHPGQRGQRQAQAEWRVAGNQVQVLTAQRPRAGAETGGKVGADGTALACRRQGLQRKYVAGSCAEAAFDQFRHAAPFVSLLQVELERVESSPASAAPRR